MSARAIAYCADMRSIERSDGEEHCLQLTVASILLFLIVIWRK